MNILGLEKVEAELRRTIQSLWEVRTKDGASVELCNFLEPVHAHLVAALELHLESIAVLKKIDAE